MSKRLSGSVDFFALPSLHIFYMALEQTSLEPSRHGEQGGKYAPECRLQDLGVRQRCTVQLVD